MKAFSHPRVGPGGSGSSKSLSILVVDDNEDAADMLSIQLRRRGHQTRTVYDGKQAVGLCDNESFDLALVDLGMPGMDGWTLARKLRERRPDLVIFAVTGYGSPRARALSSEAGIDVHLVKPASADDILAALRRLLDHERAECQDRAV